MKRRNEDQPYRNLGKNLRKLRSTIGLSQTEFGEILGVSFQQIQKYETGKNRLPALQLYMLHTIFKIPFETLFENIDLEPYPVMAPRDILLKRIRSIPDDKTALRALQVLDAALI
ncbi:MAG: helix-turn-helix domain-containing protein [Alphaproteobacteria bacterium]|nr:helix-turn-helix domain-containing protein [Alphaproteobacteria bacterium]